MVVLFFNKIKTETLRHVGTTGGGGGGGGGNFTTVGLGQFPLPYVVDTLDDSIDTCNTLSIVSAYSVSVGSLNSSMQIFS